MSETSGQRFQVRDPQGNVYGPADVTMLRDWVGQGRIVAGMHIADEADGQWVEVSVHPALADLFQGTSAARVVTATPQAGSATPANTPTPYPVTAVGQGPLGSAPLAYAEGPRQNVLGLLSMITGVAAVPVMGLSCLPICGCIAGPFTGLLALTAIVLGSIGLFQIKANPERYTGKGLAIAGLSIGIGILVLFIVGIVVLFVFNLRGHP